MIDSTEILWISASPSLKQFDSPLLQHLSPRLKIARWEYRQTLDEASSIDQAVALLHAYLCHVDRPIHLAGHGISGIVALEYAQQYPDRVRSIALLAVAPQPSLSWHTYYYMQRHLLIHSQTHILAQMACDLFQGDLPYPLPALIKALDRDLDAAPCPHSLYKLTVRSLQPIAVPLFACCGTQDFVVSPSLLETWTPYLKSSDRLWHCEAGHHFFHYQFPEIVSQQLQQFWQQLPPQSTTTEAAIAA